MLHLLDSLIRNGITSEHELDTLAQQSEEKLRRYLAQQAIGRNPLEIEAILLGLEQRTRAGMMD